MQNLDTHQHSRLLGAEGATITGDWRIENKGALGAAVMEMPDLIQAARGGDDRAFNYLIGHYQSAAQRLAQQILRTEEAAADAVQDALIKVHRALPRFQDGNFRSWLFRIVTNTCYDYLRSQHRCSALSLDDLSDSSGTKLPQLRADEQERPEMLVMQQESLQFLLKAIDELPDWHRNVVLLVDVNGYDYTEAAELLGLPLGTVKSRLSRARSVLRDQLIEVRVVAKSQRTITTHLTGGLQWNKLR